MTKSPEVIVIGAGMAGLTCAKALAERGLNVLVLEARDRVGGRIATLRVGDQEPVELGAEFVHGRPAELMALVAEAGFEVYERDGAQISFEGGELTECGKDREEMFEPLEKLKDFDGNDTSFADYLDRAGISGEERASAIGYVEGFNAADADVVSVRALGTQQVAEDAIEGDRTFHVRGGYDQLPRYLETRLRELGSEVRTGVHVQRIRWLQGQVEVVTDHGAFVATKVVVTLPLGVLLNDGERIEPEPLEIMQAAKAMRMGQVCRFTMTFQTRFWGGLKPQPAMGELSFLFTFSELPAVWWTPQPDPSASLTAWVGGTRAETLLGRSVEDLGHLACALLAKVFGLEETYVREQTTGCYMHDWSADKFSRGSYSFVAVGGEEASKIISEPVMNTLYFAGEHTDVSGHWGTVHGAMRSGLRAAEQILADQV